MQTLANAISITNIKVLHLYLNECYVSDNDLITLFRGFKNFQVRIGSIDLKDHLENMVLELQDNALTLKNLHEIFSEMLYAPKKLESVYLNLGNNLVGEQGLTNLLNWFRNCYNLTTIQLNLEKNQLGNVNQESIPVVFFHLIKGLYSLTLNLGKTDLEESVTDV